MLINTSFNVRGEPIVCTAEDAYRCFLATNMDVLVVDSFLMRKADQPGARHFDTAEHLEQFALD
jgi:carbamoyltransferase